MQVASVRMFTAAVTIIPLSLVFVGFDLEQVNSQGYVALIYAGLVGTFGAFILAFYNIKRFGATASGSHERPRLATASRAAVPIASHARHCRGAGCDNRFSHAAGYARRYRGTFVAADIHRWIHAAGRDE